jgi:MYXO-CTERM domain-containing protein
MTKIFALLATLLLSFSLSFAQTADRPSGNDTATTNQQTDNGHNYGWLGLIGLAGLAGLAGRRRTTMTETRDRTGATDIRRAA